MNEQSDRSRRDLLRIGAGAFALAASGLLLPIGDEKAEGRGKQTRRRRRRRRNANQSATGGLPQRDPLQLRGVALYIHNVRSTEVAVREWVFLGEPSEWKLKRDWETIPAKPATGPEHVVDLVDEGLQVVAELNTGHIIWGGNRPIGYPWVTIGTGGWTADGWNPRSATLLDRSFTEGDRFVAGSFSVERLNDSDDYKQFLIYLV